MSKLKITARGSYSYRVSINLILFRIAGKRVTKNFSETKEVPVDFKATTFEFNGFALTTKLSGGTLNVKGTYSGIKLGEQDFHLDELVDGVLVDVPKLESRNSWIDAELEFQVIK